MIPSMLIIALLLEPIGSVTDEPFNYGTDQIEVIDVIPLEDLERKLKQQNLRIMEVAPDVRD
jgi:hypothetical protein